MNPFAGNALTALPSCSWFLNAFTRDNSILQFYFCLGIRFAATLAADHHWMAIFCFHQTHSHSFCHPVCNICKPLLILKIGTNNQWLENLFNESICYRLFPIHFRPAIRILTSMKWEINLNEKQF